MYEVTVFKISCSLQYNTATKISHVDFKDSNCCFGFLLQVSDAVFNLNKPFEPATTELELWNIMNRTNHSQWLWISELQRILRNNQIHNVHLFVVNSRAWCWQQLLRTIFYFNQTCLKACCKCIITPWIFWFSNDMICKGGKKHHSLSSFKAKSVTTETLPYGGSVNKFSQISRSVTDRGCFWEV